MKTIQADYPLVIQISFKKLFDHYRSRLNSENHMDNVRAKYVLDVAEKYPILSEGIKTQAELKKYEKQIDIILDELFSPALQNNEIKLATLPFQDLVFKSTQRYKNIIASAGEDFKVSLTNFDDANSYIMACSIILKAYYGYSADFRRPFYYDIPDKNGLIKNYKVLFNADFIEIEKTAKAIDITEEDFAELTENFDDVKVWKEKFPPGSWISSGFILASVYDASQDVSISDFKTNLLKSESDKANMHDGFEKNFRSIFNLPELKIGFSIYNAEEETFEKIMGEDMESFILHDQKSQASAEALCSVSYYTLFKQNEFYCISDTEKYHKLYPENVIYRKLVQQGIKSSIFASIVDEGKVLGILELVSPNKNELNTINANKLRDIMPFLIDSIARGNKRLENEIELVIQDECTSIHSSVHWKFRKEAKRYLAGIGNDANIYFREITFRDVYPLYGQIDIKGSSEARNTATKDDLILQLNYIQDIIKKITLIEKLPIYDQINFRLHNYLGDLMEDLQVDSERNVLNFLRREINPLFTHLSKKDEGLKVLIKDYKEQLDGVSGLIYKHRKDYDDTVMAINKRLASIIDKKQVEAQQMYPHYFERFKTDGVEHNLYIGNSITKENDFNKVYLYNLRLWQLQVMCEMENSYYKLKDNLPMALDVASMILAFNTPLSLRFRMDEKRFDVDGTYNARYEVVKKRVDKANIKGTEERITQAGKISIIYSQKEDEIEYLNYISFLQNQKLLNDEVEMLELEDLQGVTGLKAIRVGVLYSKGKDNKEYYTYEDLITQLNS